MSPVVVLLLLLCCAAATHAAMRPHRVTLAALAVGVPIQNLMLAAVVIPGLGAAAVYAALWKEALVALAIGALLVRRPWRGQLKLPPALVLVMALTAAQVMVYLALPISQFQDTAPAPLLARLASARQWLSPLLLLMLGAALRPHVTLPRITNIVRRYGIVLAVVGLLALLALPLAFWANLNATIEVAVSGDAENASGVEGLQSFFFGQPLARLVAPFGSPLAAAFSLLFPLMLLLERRTRDVAAFPGAAVLVALALLATQTRGVLLPLVALVVLRELRGRRPALIAASLPLVLLALAPITAAVRNTFTGDDPSAVAHREALAEGLSSVPSNAIGVGLGQGGAVGRVLGQGLAGGENLFLVASNERGWLGAALAVALFMTLFVQFNRRARLETTEAPLARALSGATLVLAAASLTTEHAIAFSSTWLFWVTAGWLLAEYRIEPFAPASKPYGTHVPLEMTHRAYV